MNRLNNYTITYIIVMEILTIIIIIIITKADKNTYNY